MPKRVTKKKKQVYPVKLLIGALLVCTLVCGLLFSREIQQVLISVRDAGMQFASVIVSHNFRTVAEIKSSYEQALKEDTGKKVRVLIVAGHEPQYGGTEFGSLKERDMTLLLALRLAELLKKDSPYQVFLSRDSNGWSSDLGTYFTNSWDSIVEWRQASKDAFSRLIFLGLTTESYSTVHHNDAPDNVALRLYGITKWSNENKMDIVIHIHFNDYPRRNTNIEGEYTGFSIYVPTSQYGNSETTKVIAEDIRKRLEVYSPVSNLPQESGGIIDEPELIAIGVNNTSDAASLLIEYGYIYESQFQDSPLREIAIDDLAYQTYRGLQDFFDPHSGEPFDTPVLPHTWNKSTLSPIDIFALQTVLMKEGIYPPEGKSKNDCPRTGTLGPCTKMSLQVFQERYGISGEDEVVGAKTRNILNKIYGME